MWAQTSPITDRKRAEKRLQQLNETLEQQSSKLTAQLRALVSKLTLAEQRERRRLAEIHRDHLRQLLVRAKINSEILSASIGMEQKQTAEKVLALSTNRFRLPVKHIVIVNVGRYPAFFSIPIGFQSVFALFLKNFNIFSKIRYHIYPIAESALGKYDDHAH